MAAEEMETEDQRSLKEKFGLAAIGLLTPLLGGILGGSQGALAGGTSGLKAIGGGLAEQDKREYEAAKTNQAMTLANTKRQAERKEDLEDYGKKKDIDASNKRDEFTGLLDPKTNRPVYKSGTTGKAYLGDSLGEGVELVRPGAPQREGLTPTAAAMIGMREEDKMDKKVEALGKDLASSQELFTAIGSVEKQLGFPLDSVDDKGAVGGKPVDLPGASVPGVGRVSFQSPEARALESRIARVFNVELKDRSGAAVTTPELERLKTEFGSGRFNTEAELLLALKQYKLAATAALSNAEAKYRPEVKEEYERRGGATSKTLATPKTVFVVNAEGDRREISAEDLKYAEADGYRRE